MARRIKMGINYHPFKKIHFGRIRRGSENAYTDNFDRFILAPFHTAFPIVVLAFLLFCIGLAGKFILDAIYAENLWLVAGTASLIAAVMAVVGFDRFLKKTGHLGIFNREENGDLSVDWTPCMLWFRSK